MEEAAAALGLMSLGPYWAQAIAPEPSLSALYSLDRLPPAERAAIFSKMTPESGRALWETFHWWMDPFMTTSVPANRIQAPVMAVAGARDSVSPPASVRQTGTRLGGVLSRSYRLLVSPVDDQVHRAPGGHEHAGASGMVGQIADVRCRGHDQRVEGSRLHIGAETRVTVGQRARRGHRHRLDCRLEKRKPG